MNDSAQTAVAGARRLGLPWVGFLSGVVLGVLWASGTSEWSGPDMRAVSHRDFRSVEFAVFRGEEAESKVREYLGAGGEVNARGPIEDTMLSIAAGVGDARITDYLLRMGADPSLSGVTGETPLLKAIVDSHLDTISALFQHGADVNQPIPLYGRRFKWTPLHEAAVNYRAPVMDMLLSNGAEVNAREALHGQTALHLAASRGDEGAVRRLVSAGADARMRDWGGHTPLGLV